MTSPEAPPQKSIFVCILFSRLSSRPRHSAPRGVAERGAAQLRRSQPAATQLVHDTYRYKHSPTQQQVTLRALTRVHNTVCSRLHVISGNTWRKMSIIFFALNFAPRAAVWELRWGPDSLRYWSDGVGRGRAVRMRPAAMRAPLGRGPAK